MFGSARELSKWPCCQVSDVCKVRVGIVIKPTQYYSENKEGVRAFRSLNIGEMFVKDEDWVYFTEEANQKNQRTILRTDDVVISRSGIPGIACVITDEYDGCNAIDIIIATPNVNCINPVYLAAFTNLTGGLF